VTNGDYGNICLGATYEHKINIIQCRINHNRQTLETISIIGSTVIGNIGEQCGKVYCCQTAYFSLETSVKIPNVKTRAW